MFKSSVVESEITEEDLTYHNLAFDLDQKPSFCRKYFSVFYKPYICCLLFVYIASGISQPLLADVLRDEGLSEPSTLLYVIPTYVGMAFAALFNPKAIHRGKVRWKWIFVMCSCDVVAMSLCYIGNVLAGSIVYTIIYSSVTIWTALMSVFLLKRPLTIGQWAGVALVSVGISLTAIDSSKQGDHMFFGSIVLIVGTIVHSSTYIMSDYMFNLPEPIPEDVLCSLNGVGGLIWYGIWELSYTLPRWTELVTDKIEEKNGKMDIIMITVCFQALASLLHAVSFFRVVNHMGAVTAGVCKGLQAGGTFIFAALFFCKSDSSMCFTAMKAVSFFVVVGGVMIYSLNAAKEKKDKVGPSPVLYSDGTYFGVN